MASRIWWWTWALCACGRSGFDPIVGEGRDDAHGGSAASDATHDAPRDGVAAELGNLQTTAPLAGADGLTFTLGATQPGTLLVASIAFNSTGTLVLPSGWQLAVMNGTAGACSAALAYQLANPGNLTSLTFTLGGNTPIVGLVSEWNGPTAFDAKGSAVSGQPSAQQTVQAATATPVTELAITAFCEDDNNPAYTPGAGWTQLGAYANVASSPSITSDAQMAAAGTVGETVTSNVAGKYSAVIATFR